MDNVDFVFKPRVIIITQTMAGTSIALPTVRTLQLPVFSHECVNQRVNHTL